MNEPKTVSEALQTVYGRWGGKPQGTPWVQGRCAKRVIGGDRGAIAHQCHNKSGFGPEGLYCASHAVKFNPTQTWFQVDRNDNEIKQVEVSKSTEDSVWIEGRRTARKNQWSVYLPTIESARSYVLERAENRVSSALAELETARKELEEIKTVQALYS